MLPCNRMLAKIVGGLCRCNLPDKKNTCIVQKMNSLGSAARVGNCADLSNNRSKIRFGAFAITKSMVLSITASWTPEQTNLSFDPFLR